ncbi:MAG: exosortase system-associated protein, TIGR04073 family [Methylomonas sp.]|nr:exosortase system-associated protein, TIGR04073 family [Methylomonas sp.]PPD20445.1 MAG: hypothetical protein CTY23_08725 [Methylomonas sp.]PPD26711.1 MAG: hypothetical protein CTY22_04305 [Methylomonas sp.]PPD38531.1 MAG: hypothetical protein CTY21_04305 [Methylomonas sp.]PPD40170.1 MAG: hypothetical protein CTY17_07185 [Methylomonas sp.]
MQARVSQFKAAVLLATICTLSVAHAEPPAVDAESYGEIVSRKLLTGLSNATLAAIEIPKSMIVVNNQSNVVWGIFGGGIKGIINTAGRSVVGVIDLVTAPLPTYPIVSPEFVWEDFYADTVYGPAFIWQEPAPR